MLIVSGQSIDETLVKIEVDGELLSHVRSLNLETGEAEVWEKDVNSYGTEWVIKEVTFPLDKLHVYLVKPKT